MTVPRPIKLEKQDEDVKPSRWMEPFPQALRDMLTSSITICEADHPHDIPLPLTPKRRKIQRMKRIGPPIPQLGRPFKKRHIDTPKVDCNFIISTSQKLLLQLLQRKMEKEKNSNDELNKLAELKTEEVQIKVEYFEDEDFDEKFQELSLQVFGGGVFKPHLDDAVVQYIKVE